MSISLIVGVLVYLYFEKPLLKWLRLRIMPVARQRPI